MSPRLLSRRRRAQAGVLAVSLLLPACGGSSTPLPHCGAATDVQVPTADGGMVHLHRHPSAGPPVLLVHGIASNARFWDLAPDRSLPLELNRSGFDVWQLDLRGHGDATRDAAGRPQRSGWSIDDYGRWDIPAAIDHIRQTTGHEKVSYIGHSMGGMVAAVYISWHGDAHLQSLTVMGAPLDFRHPDPLLRATDVLLKGSTLLPSIPVPATAHAAVPVRDLPFHVDDLLFTAGNLDEPIRKAMYRHGTSPLTRGELRQLKDTLHDGVFRSVDGHVAYAAELSRLHAPLLVMAGRADHIAPPDRVRPWVEHAGSPESTFEVLGQANAYHHDYGHLDMVVGTNAPDEVYPKIIGFLEEHGKEPSP